jgi:hypothetical protein
MAKIYNGSVSVVLNTKGQITVKPDDSGKFSSANAKELYETMVALGKKHKKELRVYKPEASGDTALLFTDRWGKPYVAVLPAQKAPGGVTITRPTVTKLA